MSQIPDYTSIFGMREGLVVKTLIEDRPKWVLLILCLRKYGTMTVSEARIRINLGYRSIKTALKYLSGVELGRREVLHPATPITPLGIEPIVYLIRMPGNKKLITLTEYGVQFANRIVNYLKDVAMRLGGVDIESKYGIPKVTLISELSSRFPNIDQSKLLSRFVSFDELAINLAKARPSLLSVMRPDLIDAVPVELEIAVDRRTSKKLLLYLII